MLTAFYIVLDIVLAYILATFLAIVLGYRD